MDHPLVWIDLEMTGLDPEGDSILEIAAIVTDGQLEQTVEGPELIIHADEASLLRMAPIVAEMHEASGLTEAVRASTLTVREAEQKVLQFVAAHVPEKASAPLAGNSVHADRAFLRRHMPELESWLHYRNVDVSTTKELARRWYPSVLDDAPEKGGAHRALADIRESIEELRYYRQTIFK